LPEWLADPDRFSIEPAFALTRGGFAPPTGQAIFGSIGDSAPDTWGRRLMQRAERRLAEREGRPEIVDALTRHGVQAKTDAQALYRRVAFNVLISNVDDHLRNHGFLWLGKTGWSLSPAYDLNPVPTDLKARVLTTNIDLDEGTCSIGLLEAASEYFGLGLAAARAIIKEVAVVTATWRETAKETGARPAEITRMASAFEHDDLKRALAL
jgi:serine/threonine-protein kinase HipA